MQGSESGSSFTFNPLKMMPVYDDFTISYRVYIPSDFLWAKGGKLPGLCIGNEETACATGGKWNNSSGSFRPVWSEQGRVIGYAYVPLQAGNHGPEFERVAKRTGQAGIKLWCDVDGGLQLNRGAWNDVAVYIAMGTPGVADGVIMLWVNGSVRRVSDVAWRVSPDVGISRALFATFFGGGDPSFKVPIPTSSLFTNFSFGSGSQISKDTH